MLPTSTSTRFPNWDHASPVKLVKHTCSLLDTEAHFQKPAMLSEVVPLNISDRSSAELPSPLSVAQTSLLVCRKPLDPATLQSW